MTFDISKCKPFDLERALAGDKVVTREGEEVVQIFYAEKAYEYKIIAVLKTGDVYLLLSDGKMWEGNKNNVDLFMAPKEPVVTRKYFAQRRAFTDCLIECTPDLESWYMYIEYHDGKPVNAVFAK